MVLASVLRDKITLKKKRPRDISVCRLTKSIMKQ